MRSLNTIIQAKKDGVELTSEEKMFFRYDAEIREFVTRFEFHYFLTLTFRYPVYKKDEATRAINQFINRVSVACYGARSGKRLVSLAVLEKSKNDSYHVHMLIQDPQMRMTKEQRLKKFNLRDILIESWMSASSKTGHPARTANGDEWFRPVDGVEEAMSYMNKKFNPNSSYPSTYIAFECSSLYGKKGAA